MSNDLTTISQADIDALAALTGASRDALSGGGDYLPQLKINYDDEDANGKEIKTGLFMITGQDVTVYAKNVVIRPLMQHFQYIKYNETEKRVTNRSKFIQSFNEEAIDELGTVRCGRPTSKELKATPALKDLYADVTTYRNIHVLASYTGTDADGVEHTVENVVAVMRLKGANFSMFQEEHTDLLPKGSNIWDFPVTLSAKKEKNGASTYYVIHYEADYKARLPMTVQVLDTIKGIHERIEGINKEITAKYHAAVSGRSLDEDVINSIRTVNANGRPMATSFERDELADTDLPF